MKLANELHFVFRDRVNNIDVGPKHVPLNLLGEFQKDVSDFLRGSSRDLDPAQVSVSIEDGSLRLVTAGLSTATTLWSDLQALQKKSFEQVDPLRVAVIERWQAASRQHSDRAYLVNGSEASVRLEINASTSFAKTDETWVAVEKYIRGKVLSWGGKHKASVQIEMEDGTPLRIEASRTLLGNEETNRLYKTALLHIRAEENLLTGAIRNPRLLAFEPHRPAFDEAEFQEMVNKGTAAWADVPNATEWLENLRSRLS